MLAEITVMGPGHVNGAVLDRRLRIAWTSGSPGFLRVLEQHGGVLGRPGRGADDPLLIDVGDQGGLPGRARPAGRTGWGSRCASVSAGRAGIPGQLAGSLCSPGCTTGLPLAPVNVAPPMMLLIARAATWRLSIGLAGSYGWCRFRVHATTLPWAGVIGSSPRRPVFASRRRGCCRWSAARTPRGSAVWRRAGEIDLAGLGLDVRVPAGVAGLPLDRGNPGRP